VEVETQQPSPFARSLLFGYIAQFMYEGDSPLAERRAAALALDQTLLAELLGQADLRELLDAAAVESVERELQRRTPKRRARSLEEAADLLRLLGPLSTGEAVDRGATPRWLAELEASRRAIRVRIAGDERWAAIEDAGRLRDALGVPLPVGIPEPFLEPVKDPLGDLVARYARTHGPFESGELRARYAIALEPVLEALARRVPVERVNADEEPDRAAEHDVLSLPTVVLLVDGEPRGTVIGAKPLAHFERWLDEMLPATELGHDA
jgi:ATP-dependent Lhr-like helicase